MCSHDGYLTIVENNLLMLIMTLVISYIQKFDRIFVIVDLRRTCKRLRDVVDDIMRKKVDHFIAKLRDKRSEIIGLVKKYDWSMIRYLSEDASFLDYMINERIYVPDYVDEITAQILVQNIINIKPHNIKKILDDLIYDKRCRYSTMSLITHIYKLGYHKYVDKEHLRVLESDFQQIYKSSDHGLQREIDNTYCVMCEID